MAIYMRYWDCKYCGSKGIGGNLTECPNCGKERGSDTTFYDGESIEFLNESEAEKVRAMGEDWECPYCDGMNRGNESHCNNCGAERPVNARVYDYRNNTLDKENPNQYSIDDIFDTEEKVDKYEDKDNNFSDNQENYNSNYKVNVFDWKKVLSVGVFLSVIFLIIWLLIPKWTTAEVVNKFWEKTITIESYETLQKDGWDESVPSDARIHSKDYRYRRTDKVYSHSTYENESYQEYEQTGTKTEYYTVDLGNGYADRRSREVPVYGYVTKTRTVEVKHYKDVPVYDTWVEYEVDRWVFNRNHVSDGTYLEEEVWPEFRLADLERESSRKEDYELEIRTNKDKKKNTTSTYEISKDLYNQLDVGKFYELKVGIDGISEIKNLEFETTGSGFN